MESCEYRSGETRSICKPTSETLQGSHGRRAVAVLLIAWLVVGSVAAATVTQETIARMSQTAPGGLPGETFGSLVRSSLLINAKGDVAFIAPILGINADGTPVDGLFLKTSRGLFRLAQENEPPPGLTAPLLGKLSQLALNDAGDVAVMSHRPEGEAILSNASGAWRIVVNTADPVPSGDRFGPFGLVAESYRLPVLLRSALLPDVLFPANAIHGPNTGPGLWTADADGWDPFSLFRIGLQAPDLRPSELLAEVTHLGLGAAPARRSVFRGVLYPSSNGGDLERLQVVWSRTGRGPLEVIARSGERAPIPGTDTVYDSLEGTTVNGSGELAFTAALRSQAGGPSRVIFRGTPGDLKPVVRDGDIVFNRDGSPLGPVSLLGDPILNNAGQLLFEAITGDRQILARMGPAGRLERVAVDGDTWPGARPGWNIGRVRSGNFNNAGRVAFSGSIDAPDFDSPSFGLWLTDTNDQPVLIAMAAAEAPGFPLPEGALFLVDSFTIGQANQKAGGGDGLPRVLSDLNQVVYSGSLPDGSEGIFLARVDPEAAEPPDETFELSAPPETTWASLEASPGDAPLELPHAARLFPDSILTARPDKDWTGARLQLEITNRLAVSFDRLGLDTRSAERQRIRFDPGAGQIAFQDVVIATLSPQQPGQLEVVFTAGATTDGIRGLIRSLAMGSNARFADVLLADARHVEPSRVIRLRLVDAANRSAEAFRTVAFPSTAGLAFEGHGLDHRLWASGNSVSTTITLQLQLRLTDETRLTIGCAPTASDVRWFPNAFAGNVRVGSNNGTPCATLEMTFSATGGFPSVIRLHGWEVQHIFRREEGLIETFNKGVGFCLGSLFQLWIRSQFDGAAPTSKALATVSRHAGPAASAPIDLSAGPYALRDWMRRTEEGRRLVALYERHTGEVVRLVASDFVLFNDTLSLIREFLPALREFLSGRGDRVVLRPDMVEQVNRVWDRLAAAGSPALRESIEQERARFHGLQDFAGRTFAEWGTMLGWGSPTAPFVTVSSPRRALTGFHVEANRVLGHTYSLWRKPASTEAPWESVGTATISPADHTVALTDPNPPPAAQWYQVRTVPEAAKATRR